MPVRPSYIRILNASFPISYTFVSNAPNTCANFCRRISPSMLACRTLASRKLGSTPLFMTQTTRSTCDKSIPIVSRTLLIQILSNEINPIFREAKTLGTVHPALPFWFYSGYAREKSIIYYIYSLASTFFSLVSCSCWISDLLLTIWRLHYIQSLGKPGS